jgi:cytochrome c biogenesis protein CcmG, thiol:disulfide interchange protein DsbE
MTILPENIWGRMILLLCCCAWALTGCGEDTPKALRMGEEAPAFTAKDLHGREVSLATYAGKPVVLRFFLPDCKYCRADTAVFNDYYRDYKEKGLGVIYINTDPKPGEVQKFVDDLGISFPVVLDPDRKIADQFRVQVVPQTIILDPAHRVIGAILGGVSKEELDNLLLPFLK